MFRIVLSGVFVVTLFAQPPAFEVATVKTSPPGGDLIQINLGSVSHGTLTFTNASLSDCLRYAYSLISDAQLDGPDWITSKAIRFDIVAKAAPDTSEATLRVMLRQLLAERLGVKVHDGSRTLSYLALTAPKAASKLVPADPEARNNQNMRGRINANTMTIHRLAELLSRFERQVILDETGLSGTYKFLLEWTPDTAPAGDAPSLTTALQQLGLRLEARKGPVGILVIDHAERIPGAN